MTMKKSLVQIILITLIILFSFGLRIYSPTADLPPDISFSGSIYTDEGNQCHNSRSKVLFDDWSPDDWRISNYSPVVPFMKYLIFKIFGVGLVQERLVSYIFAFFSLLLFYLILKSYFSFSFTLLGTVVMGLNFFMVMYNRIGTFETPMIFWMILSLYFIEKFRSSENPLYLSFSAASAFLSFVFKNIAAYFVPVPLAAVIIWFLLFKTPKKESWKKGVRLFGFAFLGVAIAMGLWVVLFYIPNREWILSVPGQYISNQVLPKTLDQAIHNFYGFNWKEQFFKIPVVWLLSLLSVPYLIRNAVQRKIDITGIGFGMLFFLHTLFFMFMNHRPTRYLIPVIPAMIFMSILFLKAMTRLPGSRRFEYSFFQKAVIFISDTLWLTLAANFCFLPLWDQYLKSIRIPPLSIRYVVFSALLIGLLIFLKKLYARFMAGRIRLNFKPVSWLLIILLTGISLASNLSDYLKWNRDKTHTVYQISHELGEKLDNAYIAGLTAPVAVLENTHRSLFLYPDFVNWDQKTFERYPLTHALLASFNQEISNFFRQWPERMNRARLLKVYNVKDQFLHLYSFVDPFIAQAREIRGRGLKLRILNPSDGPVKVGIGKIFFFNNPGERIGPENHFIEEANEMVVLNPGENGLVLEDAFSDQPNPVSVLLFLDLKGWKRNHRYEAEKFPGKVGENFRNARASGGFTRGFFQKKHRAGFLSFGPFIPYSKGFLKVDFNLQCRRVRSRIRPLAELDIFSYSNKQSLDKRVLKPRDIRDDGFNGYPLTVALSDRHFLEFRVYAERFADIDLDYVNVVYYQGYLLNINHNKGSSLLDKSTLQGGSFGETR